MDIREKIANFLQSNEILSLATSDGDEVSVCNLHYYSDKDFNLYAVSSPERQHSKNIVTHKQVAVCIYDPNHYDDIVVSGIQIKGVCEQFTVNDGVDIMKAYYGKFPRKFAGEITEAEENYDFRSFYKITPTRIRVLDGRSRDLPHEITL